ncbi:MAG: vitamin B12-dependent ribonucleotide reductase, partial [Planctomycetales bacterium]
REAITHKFSIDGHEGYLNVGLFEDGRPGEVFITMAKEGSTIGGLMDCFGTAVSMSLQYGVPLEVLVNKFSHTRFDPMGFTKNPDIRYAKSLVDYIFRWLGCKFIPGFREASLGIPNETEAARGPDDSETEFVSVAKKAGGPTADQGKVEPVVKRKVNGKIDHTNGGVNKISVSRLAKAGIAPKSADGEDSRSDQFSKFQMDSPSCDNCGAITVRNGNCYLCHNCGNSMGCS